MTSRPPTRPCSSPWTPLSWAAGCALLVVSAGLPLAHAQQKPGGKAAKRAAAPAAPPEGAKLYRAQCAPCHGARAEGGPGYAGPLAGELSVDQLTAYIHGQMPPGPQKTPTADARKIAAFLYDAYYSPIAQERNRPARVALSRLTVRQYRNAVADVVGTFRWGGYGPSLDGATGLKAEYFNFKSRHHRKEDRIIERVDPAVRFDFGTGGPQGAEFDPNQFSIVWNGGIVAPDTGLYEFTVRTEHAAALWVNGGEWHSPLIDARIKSGPESEHRASVYLIGGRVYPLRMEFTKATQGVDDSEKKKGKPAPPASVSLSWKRPGLAEELVPTHVLRTESAPEVYVASAPFPPDDRSRGYERADAVSKAWDEATTTAALEAAEYVSRRREELADIKNEDPPEKRTEKLKAFCRGFVERALRRPLDPVTAERYVDKQWVFAKNDPALAIKRVVLLTLKSPRFLYRELDQADDDPYAVASRLAFGLWDAPPDKELLRAAAAGELRTREQITRQAERMAADPRAWVKQREFLLQWLKLDPAPDLAKDVKKFPGFSPAVAADLRASLEMTLEKVVRDEKSDFRELLTGDKVYLNGRLAALYGASLPPDAPFQPVSLDPEARAGVLTHPYLLASNAYVGTSSPIHRGVLLARSVLGRRLAPPPEAFTPLAPDLHPKLTTRERVAMQTSPAPCASCHNLINPLGFTMEKFDALGRLRADENGRPVDSSGLYRPVNGPAVTFKDARDLARYLADSPETRNAFVEKLFQNLTKQPVRAYGAKTLPDLTRTFAENRYNIRRLTAAVAVEAAVPKALRAAGNAAVASAHSVSGKRD